MKRIIILLLGLGLCFNTLADEGMWLPIHIKRLDQVDLQKKGLQLTPEEIYSINHTSLKDAVVNLGGGFCTGEIISREGLMLTNHHCGYDFVQSHSTVENDILTNGFWAMTKEDELPNDDLFVQFLVRIEDVTQKVLKGVKSNTSDAEREDIVSNAIAEIETKAKGESNYDVKVKSFYEGNEYYLFVYQTYYDVRLVGVPPESIGKFGGDTDNWMWPRHTGDFTLFRVYTAPDGSPAHYAPENVPLRPKYHLPVSLDGVQENDFAMVLGYPGSTNRYLSSAGVKMAIEQTNPARVRIRRKKLDIMKEAMDKDPAVRLAYASKYAMISNYWKYFIGETNGLKNLNVYQQKLDLENNLSAWISDKKSRIKKYGHPMADINAAYEGVEKFSLPFYYHLEAGFGIEFVKANYRLQFLEKLMNNEQADADKKKSALQKYKQKSEAFFKDYDPAIDERLLENMTAFMVEDLPEAFVPEVMKAVLINQRSDTSFLPGFSPVKNKDYRAFAHYIFQHSILTDKEKMAAFYAQPDFALLNQDPAYMLTKSIYSSYKSISAERGLMMKKLNSARRKFIAALRDKNHNQLFYPDANSTMRFTYGKVKSYSTKDGVYFDYKTTLKGVMEKEDPSNPEFVVPGRLKQLYQAGDFGPYGEDGRLHVAFITDNDITGGNSGSPVINGAGQLIGVAFDGNWEAMSSDIAFEHNLQRCINVDIRYVLFIIDKYAGDTRLIDEMTIVQNKPVQTRAD